MTAQKRLTDKYEPDGDAELTAIFTEEDGDTQEVAYYSYDTNYYAAVVDNKVYLVNKMNVKELFTAFEQLLEQKKIVQIRQIQTKQQQMILNQIQQICQVRA